MSKVPRSQYDYITQVSEQNERRVKKKLSKEFSRTESRFLGALSCLDGFLPNPLIQCRYGAAPETPRNTLGTNQGINEDNSQSDPHPEASVSQSQTTQNSGPDVGYDRDKQLSVDTACRYDSDKTQNSNTNKNSPSTRILQQTVPQSIFNIKTSDQHRHVA